MAAGKKAYWRASWSARRLPSNQIVQVKSLESMSVPAEVSFSNAMNSCWFQEHDALADLNLLHLWNTEREMVLWWFFVFFLLSFILSFKKNNKKNEQSGTMCTVLLPEHLHKSGLLFFRLSNCQIGSMIYNRTLLYLLKSRLTHTFLIFNQQTFLFFRI